MDSQYRTYDPTLRQARHDQLVTAARAASKATEGTDFKVSITGSVARGQTHPWSDLDLLVHAPEDSYKNDYATLGAIFDAVENCNVFDFDIIHEKSILPNLAPALLGGAKSVEEIPNLRELPSPDLAPLRAAQSFEFTTAHIRKMLASNKTLPFLDAQEQELMESMALETAVDRLRNKIHLNLKRLAVFQDGGQSRFLDGDQSHPVLADLLDRLCEPAEVPLVRPAMMTTEAREQIVWLLMADQNPDSEALGDRIEKALSIIDQWIPFLRATTDCTETHGLTP